VSYIAFELDALNVVPSVAAAAGLRVGDVSHGLLTMWAWCFREKTQHVTAVHVRGFFGSDCVDALSAFGFLQADAEGLRVRGADRYLRVSEQRRTAGKARAASAGRAAGRLTSDTPAADQRATSGGPALTPSTEHRAPNTEHLEAAVQPQPKPLAITTFVIEAPDPEAIESWTAQDFWRAFETERRAAGYPPEKWPHPNSLRDWWQEARGAFDVRVLGMAAESYHRDPHWMSRLPACPWAGFAKQWTKFIPRKAAS
jgi:hypothetical protein